ncbi:MAG: hypothetical protein AB7V27_05215 [Candidatus Binatia bacterium]
MLKRFLFGFVIGVSGMYWYIHHSGEVASNASTWMERSASHYRGDRAHQLIDQASGHPKP